MKVNLCKVAKSLLNLSLICTYWGNLPITTFLQVNQHGIIE